jgi:hypothetical protein
MDIIIKPKGAAVIGPGQTQKWKDELTDICSSSE